MKILIIETSTEKGCLILAENGVPLEVIPLGGGPELSRTLAAKCKAALHLNSGAPEDASSLGVKIDLVAIGTGPGSYTGIRVGAALAKALAYGWQVPLMGFCSLKAFGPGPVLVDAKRGGIYALLGECPVLITPCDLPLSTFFYRSPHPEIIQKRLAAPIQMQEVDPNPTFLAEAVYQQFLNEGTKPLELTYLTSP